MSKFIDLTGKRFGRLTVISYNNERKTTAWNCLCDCGNVVVVFRANLMRGHTKSCGCIRRENTIEMKKTHGMRHSAEYVAWNSMKNRCSKKSVQSYPLYGGRGIKVCERWKNSFENFFKDIGPRPSDDHSLDRIDTNGDYEPGNVKWSTREEQARNRRNNNIFIIDGIEKSLAEWCDIFNVDYHAVYSRLHRGLDIHESIILAIFYKLKRQ